MVKVIITEPIAGNRFKALPRMEDGFQTWVGHMKNKCDKDPTMKEAVMAGECRGFAAALKKQGYFKAGSLGNRGSTSLPSCTPPGSATASTKSSRA